MMKLSKKYKTAVLSIMLAGAAGLLGVTNLTHAQDTGLAIGAELVDADAAMRSVEDRNLSLTDASGEAGLVVLFWSNTCPWVERYEDRIIEIEREYRRRGIGFIALNPNDPAAFPGDRFEAMQEQASTKRYAFPYAVDEGGRIARAFGAARTPHVFVFDRRNALVYKGGIDDSPADAARVEQAHLRNALDAVAGGRSVQAQTTNAFGCTIKW